MSANVQQRLSHRTLPCGVELATEEIPERRAVAMEFRIFAGTGFEPEDRPGLAHLVQETLDKGTTTRTGQQISDDFDAIGARRSSHTGREAIVLQCLCLPEFVEQAIALHADVLRNPTFPEDVVAYAIALAEQELILLEDDPHAVVDRALDRQAWGPVLGRHPLGNAESLKIARREELESYWKRAGQAGRMQVAVAGAMSSDAIADVLDRHFQGWGVPAAEGRNPFSAQFEAKRTHLHKTLEQQQIGLCTRGVPVDHDEFPIETVLVRILSGGMSSRLFTEVREKRGLVYWVSAWQEVARGSGMISFGASSTPQNCEETLDTMLREVSRISEDLTQDELDRAITGLSVRSDISGDVTRARCSELASDMFYRKRLIPRAEKIRRIQAVTRDDIVRYLDAHPRDALSIVTLGPKPPNAA